eukprot:6172920-Pleurochrysis_carterae.AAC.4
MHGEARLMQPDELGVLQSHGRARSVQPRRRATARESVQLVQVAVNLRRDAHNRQNRVSGAFAVAEQIHRRNRGELSRQMLSLRRSGRREVDLLGRIWEEAFSFFMSLVTIPRENRDRDELELLSRGMQVCDCFPFRRA